MAEGAVGTWGRCVWEVQDCRSWLVVCASPRMARAPPWWDNRQVPKAGPGKDSFKNLCNSMT